MESLNKITEPDREDARAKVESIEEDSILAQELTVDDKELIEELCRSDNTKIIVCQSGAVELRIDMQCTTIESPAMMILTPERRIEPLSISPNFGAIFISMSDRFIDMLNINSRAQMFMTLRNNPVIQFDTNIMSAVESYRELISRSLSHTQNPYRMEVVENFTRAFFYACGFYFHEFVGKRTSTYQDSIVEKFIVLVRENYRMHRRIGFYADKLCITPKYLSKVIKQSSGQSAVEWIDSYVLLEARAMLKSSHMTIQQIAGELNFPNQSFFGKYFKRMTGMSPKEYREGGGKSRHAGQRGRR